MENAAGIFSVQKHSAYPGLVLTRIDGQGSADAFRPNPAHIRGFVNMPVQGNERLSFFDTSAHGAASDLGAAV